MAALSDRITFRVPAFCAAIKWHIFNCLRVSAGFTPRSEISLLEFFRGEKVRNVVLILSSFPTSRRGRRREEFVYPMVPGENRSSVPMARNRPVTEFRGHSGDFASPSVFRLGMYRRHQEIESLPRSDLSSH